MVDLEPHDALVLGYQLKASEVDLYSAKIAALTDADPTGQPMSTATRAAAGEDGGQVVEERRHTPELSLWIKARDAATRDMVAFAKAPADAASRNADCG